MSPQPQNTFDPVHNFKKEFMANGVNNCINIGFTVGSIFFLQGMPSWCTWAGDIIFIVCSLAAFLMSASSLWEVRHALPEHVKDRHKRDEVFRTFLFAASAFIFFIGSFFYYPGIYPDEETKFNGEWWGAWFFVYGSFGYVLAIFYEIEHAVRTRDQHNSGLDAITEQHVYYLHKYSLLAALIGSVFFVVGSFFYRPGFNTHCTNQSTLTKLRAKQKTVEYKKSWWQIFSRNPNRGYFCDALADACHSLAASQCLNAMQFGTWCYVIGASLFLLESVFDCIVLMMRCSSERKKRNSTLKMDSKLGIDSKQKKVN